MQLNKAKTPLRKPPSSRPHQPQTASTETRFKGPASDVLTSGASLVPPRASHLDSSGHRDNKPSEPSDVQTPTAKESMNFSVERALGHKLIIKKTKKSQLQARSGMKRSKQQDKRSALDACAEATLRNDRQPAESRTQNTSTSCEPSASPTICKIEPQSAGKLASPSPVQGTSAPAISKPTHSNKQSTQTSKKPTHSSTTPNLPPTHTATNPSFPDQVPVHTGTSSHGAKSRTPPKSKTMKVEKNKHTKEKNKDAEAQPSIQPGGSISQHEVSHEVAGSLEESEEVGDLQSHLPEASLDKLPLMLGTQPVDFALNQVAGEIVGMLYEHDEVIVCMDDHTGQLLPGGV